MLFPGKCFHFGEKYHISGKCLGVSGKFFSYLGKIWVCPEKFFDSQNGTLTENFWRGGGEVAEVEQRGVKSGRLTEGPRRLRYATEGPDEIPARLLTETAYQIAPPLCLLFNKSLKCGIVPREWKLANVVPIHKKGDKHHV
jgi:hypothetical protein